MSSLPTPLPGPLLDATLTRWLDTQAVALDEGHAPPGELVPRLADAGLFRIGVETRQGGSGGTPADAIEAMAAVAEYSLTAAFVFWGQRAFIEYLLHSPNHGLSERCLPSLLAGTYAGATGLSNAMKYLGGIEALQVQATDAPHGWTLNGKLPWVTNLRKEGFVVAAAVDHPHGAGPSIFAIPHDVEGVIRSADLDLVALRSSNTAAIRLEGVELSAAWQIHPDALQFLPRVRPAFLGLQCSLSIGLARRSLREARSAADSLGEEIEELERNLQSATQRLIDGVLSGVFQTRPAPLFEIRIALASIAAAAAGLEVQASGGRGYMHSSEVARRWREAAFIPVVTPSLTQLKSQLAQHARSQAS
jgi:alkylation response protein AidB-like acyl-CoA dehydrogenase